MVGGCSVKEVVKRCFEAVFTKSVSRSFVFQGGFNTRKEIFEKLRLKEVIFAAVALHADDLKMERPTEAAMKVACQSYFKNAADNKSERLKSLKVAAKQKESPHHSTSSIAEDVFNTTETASDSDVVSFARLL